MQIWIARLALLFVLLLTAALYSLGLNGPFVLDDLQTLDTARVASFNWQNVWHTSLANEAGPLNRPFSVFTFIITDTIFGPTPFGYKLTNLLLHLLMGVLLFSLVQKWTYALTHIPLNLGRTLAFLVTALWLLHPLLVSTVLYAVQRMAMLSALLSLAAFWCYLKPRLDTNPIDHSKKNWYGAAVICAILALLSKENAILLPGLIFVFEGCIPKNHPNKSKPWTLFWGICFLLILCAAIAYYWTQWDRFQALFEEKNTLPFKYLALETKALVFYLKQIILPKLNDFGLYHDDFQYAFPLPVWISTTILIALLVSIPVTLKKMPLYSFGILWFFIGHLLESTLIPLEPVFEHRNYLPSIGILLALSALLIEPLKHGFCQKIIPLCLPLFILLASTLTLIRVQSWSTPEKFLWTQKTLHPLSASANIEWANHQFNQLDFNEAIETLEKAYTLNPSNAGPKVHVYLAHCFMKKEPNLQNIQNALQNKAITPYTILVFDALVQNHMQNLCRRPVQETLQLISLSLNNPQLSHKPRYQAVLYHLKAGLLIKQNALPHAVIALDKAYKLNPKRLEPLIEKARLLLKLNDQLAASETLRYVKKQPHSNTSRLQEKIQHLESFLE